jgi:hypothetical protein
MSIQETAPMPFSHLIDLLLGAAAEAARAPHPEDALLVEVRGRPPVWPVERTRPWHNWGPQRRSLTLFRHH